MTPALVAVAACTRDPAPPPGGDGPAPAPTAETAAPPPDTLTVGCAATDNALRLRCEVDVSPPQGVSLRWARQDGAGPERSAASPDPAAHHTLPLRFLAPETVYDVVAVAASGAEAHATVVAGTPPVEVGSWLTPLSGASSAGLWGTANPCGEDAHAVVYDTATGALVWYQDLDPDGALGVLNMVRFTDAGTVAGETRGRVVEVDRDGVDLARFAVDYGGEWGLHHELFVRDGRYWSGFQDTAGDLTVDLVVALDRGGSEVDRWDPREHLAIPPDAADDWLHTNALSVDDDGSALVSWMHRDAIARIAAAPAGGLGEVAWVLGPADGPLGSDLVLDWSRVDGDDAFGSQHSLSRRRDGRLLLLDNPRGRALLLSLDEGARRGVVEAAFRTREPVCGAQGTAVETPTGNVAAACFGPWVAEYDVDTGARVWEARLACRSGREARAVRWYPLAGWE